MVLGTVAAGVIRHLLPNRGLGPPAFGVKLGWLLLICLGLCYLALMPCTFLPDVGLGDFTSLYVTAVGLALAQMLAIIVGSWLMYTYVYLVTVPIVRPIEQGRPLVHLAVDLAGANLLRTLIRLAHTWALIYGVFGREPAPYLTPTSLRPPIRQGIPDHLATGWRAGSHPQVLYS